jgi:DNA-binding HxlR family transcriptional regulator
MKWSEIDQETCSVARTLAVIGDRWSMLIIHDTFLGTRRFEDFCRQLGISRPALTDRLRKLEHYDVLEKQPYQDRPTRFEYRLTEKGVDLYPIIITMVCWGDKWQDDGNGPPLEYQHLSCGHKTQPVMCCSECAKPLHAREVLPQLGPGLKSALENVSPETANNTLPPFLHYPTTGKTA